MPNPDPERSVHSHLHNCGARNRGEPADERIPPASRSLSPSSDRDRGSLFRCLRMLKKKRDWSRTGAYCHPVFSEYHRQYYQGRAVVEIRYAVRLCRGRRYYYRGGHRSDPRSCRMLYNRCGNRRCIFHLQSKGYTIKSSIASKLFSLHNMTAGQIRHSGHNCRNSRGQQDKSSVPQPVQEAQSVPHHILRQTGSNP